MSALDVSGAPARLLANSSVTPGHCLMYVSRAIRNGASPLIWQGLDTAYNCWRLACGNKSSSRDVPAGYPAFLGPRQGSAAGDVIISLGDGTFAATDWPRNGVVGVCTLAQREKQTGRQYLGYAREFLGYTLTNGGTAGSGTTIKEDDMAFGPNEQWMLDQIYKGLFGQNYEGKKIALDPNFNEGKSIREALSELRQAVPSGPAEAIPEVTLEQLERAVTAGVRAALAELPTQAQGPFNFTGTATPA